MCWLNLLEWCSLWFMFSPYFLVPSCYMSRSPTLLLSFTTARSISLVHSRTIGSLDNPVAFIVCGSIMDDGTLSSSVSIAIFVTIFMIGSLCTSVATEFFDSIVDLVTIFYNGSLTCYVTYPRIGSLNPQVAIKHSGSIV